MPLPVPVVYAGPVVQQVLDDLQVATEHGQDEWCGLCVVFEVDEALQSTGRDQLLAQVLKQLVAATEDRPVQQRSQILEKKG